MVAIITSDPVRRGLKVALQSPLLDYDAQGKCQSVCEWIKYV